MKSRQLPPGRRPLFALTLSVASVLVAAFVAAAPSPTPPAGPAAAAVSATSTSGSASGASAPKKPVVARGPKLGVATESRQASEAALKVLERGGSAVDAVITAALVAGVVAPTSSGLGGGGVALVFRASDHSLSVLDFREAAPAELDAAAFERRPLPDEERGKLVGVPGEARGLAWLHQHYGKRPWAELVAPAERLARDGFALEPHMEKVIGGKDAARYRRMPSIERAFWPNGKVAQLGQRLRRPELARTLHTLAQEGAEALYRSPIADDLVAAARKFGGALSKEDLARYRVRTLEPLHVAWEEYDVFTMPPPSAGGLLLAEVLGTFSRRELTDAGLATPLGVHLVAEAMRGALVDRATFVGDPGVLPIDVGRLLAPARLGARKARILPDRTQAVQKIATEEHGTHAMIVADAEGNVVSLTTTVNTAFGAKIDAEKSGIVLNDELDDFTALAASKAAGVRFPPNAARPFVRPTSSMMPTIVLRDGAPVLALGGSGGYTIPPNVTETLLGVLVQGDQPQVAVSAPRFRFDPREYSLLVESGFSDAMREDLSRRGETVRIVDFPAGVQVLAFDSAGVSGAADPRKGGVALVR